MNKNVPAAELVQHQATGLAQIAQDHYEHIITIFDAIGAVAHKSPDLAVALALLGNYVAEISHADLDEIGIQIHRSSTEVH
jgi:hypothetical protein